MLAHLFDLGHPKLADLTRVASCNQLACIFLEKHSQVGLYGPPPVSPRPLRDHGVVRTLAGTAVVLEPTALAHLSHWRPTAGIGSKLNHLYQTKGLVVLSPFV